MKTPQGESPKKTIKFGIWLKKDKKFMTLREWKKVNEVQDYELKPLNKLDEKLK